MANKIIYMLHVYTVSVSVFIFNLHACEHLYSTVCHFCVSLVTVWSGFQMHEV